MSQAEELLNSMSEEVSVHTHPVPDTDTYFIIDPITRKIENTNRKKTVVMQYDHNSERFTFELPRFVDGHDMLECTSVTVNVDNIEIVESELGDSIRGSINSDAPDMTDLRVHPNDPDKVISSWLISRNSTQLAGILSFHIEYKCVAANGDVVYEWGTDTYDEIEVKARKKNGEAAVSEYTDVLEQWRTQIFGAGDSVMANIASEGNTQIAAVKAESETQQEAVELKGSQTLDSIPEDYTTLDTTVDDAVRSKANAIVCEAEGETIVINDSSNDYIRGFKVFGKSTQDGTPTPDNPVEIVSVENPTVNVCGKNLFDKSTIAEKRSISTSGGSLYASDTSFASDYILVSGVKSVITNMKSSPSGFLWGAFYNSNKGYVSGFQINSTTSTVVEIPLDAKYIRIACLNELLDVAIVAIGNVLPVYENYVKPRTLNITSAVSGLPGIPGPSDGNYTDSDGQQWICDEIDFERGVYVQRIAIEELSKTVDFNEYGLYCSLFKGTSKYSTRFICSHASSKISFANGRSGAYVSCVLPKDMLPESVTDARTGQVWLDGLKEAGTPCTVAYILTTPRETPLTAEEIATFKALRTNYPNTTVLNDAGAWVKMEYNADTKLYVDNKIISAVNAYLTEHLN